MKTLKRVAIILLGLVLILWLAFTIFAEPVLKSTITEKLKNHPQDSVSIRAINLKIFPPGLKLKDIYFDVHIPKDSSLINLKGELDRIAVGGIKWKKALKNQVFDIGVIKIKEGKINWVSSSKLTSYTQDTSESKTIPPITIRVLKVNDIQLSAPHDSVNIQLTFSLKCEDIHLEKQDSLKWDVKRVTVASRDGHFENIVEDYNLGYQSLQYDSEDSTLTARNFSMEPILSRDDFVKKYPYRKVQPTLLLQNTTLSGIDPSRLNEGLFAKALVIDSAGFDIYQDIRLDRPDVRKPMPSELIAKAPIPLDIDSLILKNANLKYHHRPKQENLGLAQLSLSEITLKAYPISNIGHTDCADLNLSIAAILENRPKLNLQAQFFGDKPHHNFEVNLSMSATDLGAFNEILYPTVGLKIKEGKCSGAKVHMQGNDYSVQGYLDIAYTNLRVALPADQEDELKFFKRGLESIGNFALVNNNNEMGNKRGEIFYKRPAKEPFVNFWWKGIQGGLLDVITPFYTNTDKK